MLIVKAFAKINLTLRVLGVREDGYHTLRTVFQTLALHDTLTCQRTSGAFRIACDDRACPTDRSNLVWRAAEAVWRAAGRRGRPRDAIVAMAKRIPLQSGLGGGSSDAAAAIRGLAALWRVQLSRERQHAMAAGLGADVPFFLEGGTSLGLDRGDVLFPLADPPTVWVTLAVPPFGVSTKEAYEWFDRSRSGFSRTRPSSSVVSAFRRTSGLPPGEFANDLQRPVSSHHPEVRRLVASLRRFGAMHAAMSGSGSAVFGLFESRARAETAARVLAGPRCRTIVTRTINRKRFADGSRARRS
jgi:4-diphosphocytidyl-2-C-methyl-D-erythritol kinase